MSVRVQLARLPTRYGFSILAHRYSFFAKEIQRAEENPFYQNGIGTYEHFESEKVISLVRPNDFCIDAGAHVGYFTCLMANAGASVIACEPNPEVLVLLRENAEAFNGRIMVINEALTDQEGRSALHLSSEFDDGLSSLCWPQSGPTISVRTTRLDDLVEAGTKIRLLKLDVEGSELAALRGLGKLLADVEYILIECASSNTQIPEINDLLHGWTVQRCGLGTWDRMSAALPDGNYLFTNPKVA